MRILWVAHFAGIDGANLNLVESIDALAARGHQSDVVLPGEGPLEERIDGATGVHHCHHNQWLSGRRIGVTRTARWLAYNRLVAARDIAAIARDIDADVIVSNTAGVVAGALAARRAALPHVWFLHELVSTDFGMRFALGWRPTMWLMRRLAVEVMANGQTVRDRFVRDLKDFEMPVIGCWARVPAAESAEPVAPAADGKLRLVSVGSWIPGKRQAEAIEAVGLLRRQGVDLDLDLVGGCEQWFRPELERRAELAGVADSVSFVPFQDDPSPFYLRAHAALMCSARDALPRAAIEPLKFARPVIAAGGGGVLDIIEEGRNGLLYRPGDPRDLARRIGELNSDRDRLRALGERARRDALAEFNGERVGAALEGALLRVTETLRNASQPRLTRPQVP